MFSSVLLKWGLNELLCGVIQFDSHHCLSRTVVFAGGYIAVVLAHRCGVVSAIRDECNFIMSSLECVDTTL